MSKASLAATDASGSKLMVKNHVFGSSPSSASKAVHSSPRSASSLITAKQTMLGASGQFPANASSSSSPGSTKSGKRPSLGKAQEEKVKDEKGKERLLKFSR